MKKVLFSLFAMLLAASALLAQTQEEILAKMNQECDRFETEGFSVVMDMKLPILGTFSTQMYTLGDKFKGVVNAKGETSIMWSDSITDWDYDVSKNELTITNAKPSEDTEADDNVKVLKNVTEGYDVKLKKETADAWYFVCTKSKDNTNKDDPKKMDLVVSKATYLPVSTTIKEKGVTVTMRDFAVGVTEEQVTFDPAKYAKAKIIDKR
ncbi:MAG: hypothetical protein J5646_06195 [Bacteroidales bacterium]|nr:hypothetical protein [Bacteroidales bacterium]